MLNAPCAPSSQCLGRQPGLTVWEVSPDLDDLVKWVPSTSSVRRCAVSSNSVGRTSRTTPGQ
jgi:hypothetical protein